MNQTERQRWQERIEFYGKKIDQYKARHPDRWPSKSTIRRWDNEFKMLSKTPPTKAFNCGVCEFDEVCPIDKGRQCFWINDDDAAFWSS